MRSRTLRLAAVTGLAGAGLLAVVAVSTGPAAATGCVPVLHNNTDGVTLVAGGKASSTAGGLLMETPVNDDAVVWKRTLTVPVPLNNVDQLSYRTRKLDPGTANSSAAVALPAYRLYLEGTDGPNETTTLVYEPYWQTGVTAPVAVNTTVTWDVDAGKWWSTKSINDQAAGSGGPPFKTLAEVVAKNPNARVVAFGVGQGTYNPGTKALANEVSFKGKLTCETHSWVAPAVSSSASSSASASVSSSSKPPTSSSSSKPPTSSSSSASSSATPGVFFENCTKAWEAGAAPIEKGEPGYQPELDSDKDGTACEIDPRGTSGGGGSLPRTGDSVPVAMIATGGVGAVLLGIGLVVIAMRRRRQPKFDFEA